MFDIKKTVNEARESVKEAAERVYDIVKDGSYDVKMNVLDKEKKGTEIHKVRPTRHTIKWRAKGH